MKQQKHSKNLEKLLKEYKFRKIVPEDCQRCRLRKSRTQVVHFGGRIHSKIIIIGEGPGQEEDIKGKPFVGRSGKKLFSIIRTLGFKRKDFLILNMVKCRPPNNRNPKPDEIRKCSKFLKKQLRMSRAKVVIVLGKVAWRSLTGTDLPVTKYHGIVVEKDDKQLVYVYHPSYVLRNNTVEINKNFRMDIKVALITAGLIDG